HDAEPDSKPGLASFWPGLAQPPPAGLMVNVNDVLPELPAVSVAVTVTVNVPAVVGVPDTVPVDDPMLNPGGSPAADQVYGGVPPDAVIVNDVIGVPTVPVLFPGLFTVTPAGAPNCVYSSRFGEPAPGLLTTFGVEALISPVATWAGVSFGWPASHSAAPPVTCGVAIEVPLIVLVAVSLVFHDEVMFTPGAKMSVQVPKLENDARASLMSVAFTVIAAATRAGEKLHASALELPDAMAKVTPELIAALTALSRVGST